MNKPFTAKYQRLLWWPLFFVILLFCTSLFVEPSSITEPWILALILLIVIHFYSGYFYEPPRDIFFNSVNAILLLLPLLTINSKTFLIFFVFLIITFLSSFLYLIFYERFRKLKKLKVVANNIGRAKLVFPLVAVSYFINIQGGTFDPSLKWIIIYYLIFLLCTSKWFLSIINKEYKHEYFGIIKKNLWPNLVIAGFSSKSIIKINDLIKIGSDIDSKNVNNHLDKIGLVIDFVGAESEREEKNARIFLIGEPQRNLGEEKSGLISVGSECYVEEDPEDLIKSVNSDKLKYLWKRRKDIIGLVAPGSKIDNVVVDTVRYNQPENAELITVLRPDTNDIVPIRYQIIEATTHRESEEDKKDAGFTRFFAHQLGEWRRPTDEKDQEEENQLRQFFEYPWVSSLNSLVFQWSKEEDEGEIGESPEATKGYFLLGQIPKTRLPIYLNIKEFVQHHSSILGITGSGKSTLVRKMINSVVKEKILVLCIDLTGEYKRELSEDDYISFFNQDTSTVWIQKIEEIKQYKMKTQLSYNDKEKLSNEKFEQERTECEKKIFEQTFKRLSELYKLEKIVIFDIKEISNTRLTIEHTQYIIESVMRYAKNIYEGVAPEKFDEFQVCFVLEEAHTLIPENAGYSFPKRDEFYPIIDKISQVALQGRKYHVGFILIAQRTATVKKTILNQSNTIISFRAYDETSFQFLANYFGAGYVKEIIHLKNDGSSRYVIVSGKALVADRPVIVEVKP
jgi:hypothetical protein